MEAVDTAAADEAAVESPASSSSIIKSRSDPTKLFVVLDTVVVCEASADGVAIAGVVVIDEDDLDADEEVELDTDKLGLELCETTGRGGGELSEGFLVESEDPVAASAS